MSCPVLYYIFWVFPSNCRYLFIALIAKYSSLRKHIFLDLFNIKISWMEENSLYLTFIIVQRIGAIVLLHSWSWLGVEKKKNLTLFENSCWVKGAYTWLHDIVILKLFILTHKTMQRMIPLRYFKEVLKFRKIANNISSLELCKYFNSIYSLKRHIFFRICSLMSALGLYVNFYSFVFLNESDELANTRLYIYFEAAYLNCLRYELHEL